MVAYAREVLREEAHQAAAAMVEGLRVFEKGSTIVKLHWVAARLLEPALQGFLTLPLWVQVASTAGALGLFTLALL